MPTLHRQSEEFDDRNLFLQVLLGLVSVSGGFERVASEWAPAERRETQPIPHAAGDPAELLLLGLIGVSRRFMDHVGRAAEPEPSPAVPAAATAPIAAPDALRRLLV